MTTSDAAGFLPADHPALAPSTDLGEARSAVVDAHIDPAAEEYRRTVVDFVDRHDDALDRSCAEGHLTGSALVVADDGRHVVVLHHRKLRRWLQPGGHCDGNANLAAVALREATEETGIDGLVVHPVAIDVDAHEVDPPAEGPHVHYDVRYLVLAPAGAALDGNHESTAIRWAVPDELVDLGADQGLVRMVEHGLSRLRHLRDAGS